MKWYFTFSDTKSDLDKYQDMAKGHVVPECLLEQTLQDFRDRNFIPHVADQRSSFRFDLPGPMMMDREYISIDVDDFNIEIPMIDAEIIYYETFAKSRERNELKDPFHKLHFWNCCLVLTPEQYKKVADELQRQLPVARAVGALEVEKLNHAVNKLNEHPNLQLSMRKQTQKIEEA